MSTSRNIREITELMQGQAFGEDVLAILNALGSFKIAEELNRSCNSGLGSQIVAQHFAPDATEMLLSLGAIEEVDGRIRMTDLGYEAYRPFVHPSILISGGPGALNPTENNQ